MTMNIQDALAQIKSLSPEAVLLLSAQKEPFLSHAQYVAKAPAELRSDVAAGVARTFTRNLGGNAPFWTNYLLDSVNIGEAVVTLQPSIALSAPIKASRPAKQIAARPYIVGEDRARYIQKKTVLWDVFSKLRRENNPTFRELSAHLNVLGYDFSLGTLGSVLSKANIRNDGVRGLSEPRLDSLIEGVSRVNAACNILSKLNDILKKAQSVGQQGVSLAEATRLLSAEAGVVEDAVKLSTFAKLVEGRVFYS